MTSQTDFSGSLVSATLGIGSFVTLTFSIGGSEISAWLYQCYWELKDGRDDILLTSEMTSAVGESSDIWAKVVGSQLNSFSSSPGLFEIIMDDFSVICISHSKDADEDDIGVRLYAGNVHLMDVRI